MSSHLKIVAIVLVAAAGLKVAGTLTADVAPAAAALAERASLTAHFDSVVTELQHARTTALTPAQHYRRNSLIERLRAYRDAQTFPHNETHPASRVPVFRDAHGHLCAMGDLLAFAGRRDLVQAVVAINNNAYIAELGRTAALTTWLDSVGLTLAEAARVQPAYQDTRTDVQNERRWLWSSIIASSTLAGATAWEPHRGLGVLAMAAGLTGVVLGNSIRDQGTGNRGLAGSTMVFGAVAVAVGLSTFVRTGQPDNGTAAIESGARRLNVSPVFALSRGRVSPGFAARIRF